MKNPRAALLWITNILKKHQIPFQISGGLAAITYGANRELADIDIDIPDDQFEKILNDVNTYIIYGPAHFKSELWDLQLMTLNYQGQEIDISGADSTHIFDNQTKKWVKIHENLDEVSPQKIFDLYLPVIPIENLIAYKKILSREVDLIDILQIQKYDIEIQDDQITKMGIDAIIDFYHTMAVDELSTADAKGFVTGAHSSFLNVLFDLRQKFTDSSNLIKIADDFFNKHHLPWGWFIVPPAKNDLLSHNFKFLQESPAMYFDLTNLTSETKSDLITFKEIQNKVDLEEWILPINDGFEVEKNDNTFFDLNLRLLNEKNNKLKHYIAYYDGKIGASATLFISNDSVMIHNVATKKTFRNFGLATALTLHMMQKAKQLGFKHCYLDSSHEAVNLYKKIGFKVYCTTLIYSKNK